MSSGGKLRLGVKADLLHCLEKDLPEETGVPMVDAAILDGAAVVQMLNPGTSNTFQEYADAVFVPYVSAQLKKTNRVDIVWDIYSLKSTTKEKRGKGIRKRVASSTQMPTKWKDFLRVDANKTELFSFLSQESARLSTEDGKEVYATHGREVLCSSEESDLANLAPCSQEEPDTRLLLHVVDAVQKGSKKVVIRTVDTDVVVVAASSFSKINPDELWVAVGTGSRFRYIAIHELVAAMNSRQCSTLPVFHATTGCDTVSSFAGRGKKTTWETWKVFPEVTQRSRSRTLKNIQPTQAALKQHIKRACYQANSWNQALVLAPDVLDPSEWGWTIQTGSGWQTLWTTLPEAAKSCHELIHCGCRTGCTGRFKCRKAALNCTALCFCSGDC